MKDLFVDEHIDKQALISAVEEFAFKHETQQIDRSLKKYRELIPAKSPGAGQQYAFEVDMDKCTGCKACVTACHNENGLDEDETWRSVGLIHGGTSSQPVLQHVTTACHHCLDPACMNGCPTLAYTKDPVTGIVKHLEDQCFGCQYCILKCPYDVPKYNKKRGIVHKCDMCIGRLNDGQAPACARACPNGAIRVTLVDVNEVKRHASEYVKIAGAPASDYTFPTTKYKTSHGFSSNMISVDHHTITPEHSHIPLVVMLVLTQLSVGAFFMQIVFQVLMLNYSSIFSAGHAAVVAGLGLLALVGSVCHLGRPHLAFRAVLGFKTSWLSREIIAFVLFAASAVIYALSCWIKPFAGLIMSVLGSHIFSLLGLTVAILGLIGIFCSVMVYRDTKRPFWDNPMTAAKFFMTAIILGCATMLLTASCLGFFHAHTITSDLLKDFGNKICQIIVLTSAIKLLLEAIILLTADQNSLSFMSKTAILMTRHLKRFTLSRFICGTLGGIVFPFVFMQMNQEVELVMLALAVFIFIGSLAGEFLERLLFFKAVVPLKMPGGLNN